MKKLLVLFFMFASFAMAQINLNTATLEELTSLKGIGVAKAQAIMAARPFKSIEELKNIKGIGTTLYNALKDQVTVK